MLFSLQTVAFVATLSTALAGPISERSGSLCNQQNYGAVGYPWQSNSSPGAFCSKNKPANSPAWQNIPSWDGGDSVRCSNWYGQQNFNVCKGGNPTSNLPSVCSPPHNLPAGWGKPASSSSVPSSKSPAPSAVVTCGSTTTCTAPKCSSSYWWSLACLYPSNWLQTCVTTPKPCAGATSTAPVKTFTTTAASVPSSASANTGTASLSFATTYTSPAVTSTAAPTTAVVSSTTSSAAPVSTSAVPPIQYPVCETTYQVTYLNYTMVAPNGVWAGLTVGSATQDASYMTYTLANTIDDCLAACDQIEGCVFVNTYYDVNAEEADLPKHTPGVLTCSMYSQCVGTDKNDNFGGQDDPNTIVNSNGYCKSGACSS